MTESQIERIVEIETNALDRQFMSKDNVWTQEEYNAKIRELDIWAENQISAIR